MARRSSVALARVASGIEPRCFGPDFDLTGKVVFQFRSTKARAVELWLKDPLTLHERRVPMCRDTQTSFSWSGQGLSEGTLYQFIDEFGSVSPDPWSRSQPNGVHGPSELMFPQHYCWAADDWKGRPWHETVIYEIHVGALTPEGTLDAARAKLDHIARLGFTAVQLMPISVTPDGPNWGYDGTFPFAIDRKYGSRDDLKRFVDAAHARGIQVILDVVYNHFGPEGNYLYGQMPCFFNAREPTPWGASLNFDGSGSGIARDFVLANALYWLDEFRIDGLRIDAPHMIRDGSPTHILEALNEAVQCRYSKDRHVHLILECRNVQASSDGYCVVRQNAGHLFSTFLSDHSLENLAEALTTNDADLAVSPAVLPMGTHDDVGNNQHGKRLWQIGSDHCVKVLLALVLLSPAAPMIFMGDESASRSPFNFFCRFKDISEYQIQAGRMQEFGEPIDSKNGPFSEAAFRDSILDWTRADQRAADARAYVRHLLSIRETHLSPHLSDRQASVERCVASLERLSIIWQLKGARLHLDVGEKLPPSAKGENSIFLLDGDTEAGFDGLQLRWALEV